MQLVNATSAIALRKGAINAFALTTEALEPVQVGWNQALVKNASQGFRLVSAGTSYWVYSSP